MSREQESVQKLPVFNWEELKINPSLIRYGNIKPLSLQEAQETTGNTPLVLLEKQGNAELYAKIEGANPTGSIKMRTASIMLKDALEKDLIDPEKGIVVGSGGNFAIALAALCQIEEIPLTVSLLASAPKDVTQILTNFGAKVISESQTRDQRREITLTLAEKGYCFLDQHNSAQALIAIGKSIAPEIRSQTQGRVTDITAGFGTGMTVFGTSIYFRKRFQEGQVQQPVVITAVEDDLSLLGFQVESLKVASASIEEKMAFLQEYQRATGRKFRVYRTQDGEIGKIIFSIGDRAVDDIPGIGISGLQPATQELLKMRLIDNVIAIDPIEARNSTRALQERGLYVGISSGAAYLAAKQVFERKVSLGQKGSVVAIFPDTGTLYNKILYPNGLPDNIQQNFSYLFQNI